MSHNPNTVSKRHIVIAAAGLMSDSEDLNPEYDRALSEIVCDLVGISMDDTAVVRQMLRAMQH